MFRHKITDRAVRCPGGGVPSAAAGLRLGLELGATLPSARSAARPRPRSRRTPSGAATLTMLAARRHRLGRSGPDLLPVRLPGPLRHQPCAVLLQARRLDERRARPRRRRAAGLRGPEDDHDQAAAGRQVRPAGQPRGHLQGRQVRHRAHVHHDRPERLHERLLLDHRRRAHGGRQDVRPQALPGPRRRRTTPRSSSSSRSPMRRSSPARSCCRCDRSRCPRSTRRSSTPRRRRTTTSTPSPPART